MNKTNLKRIGLVVIFFFLSPLLWAQAVTDTSGVNIDDTMRSHGKIYVVMAVCITILVVFFLYLLRIDRKVSRKENPS